MAVSLINTECKRYGCIKNLLACYANCRYNSRCDDLRNEIEGKTEQAARDINQYLIERGGSPIAIQFMKRGLKFTKIGSKSPEAIRQKQPGPLLKLRGLASKPDRAESTKVSAKKRTMSRRAKNSETRNASTPARPAVESSAFPDSRGEKKPEKRRSKPRKPKEASSSAKATRKSAKSYIILEGSTASLVDERGLMQHILSGTSKDVRYFEAIEVEARLQIVARR